MRRLARLEYEPESGAFWYIIFRQSPKAIAEQKDWPLAEVVRRATELYVRRFVNSESETSA
jgi:hypothetical protein